MGKVIIEIPDNVHTKIKARNIGEAIRKLDQLKNKKGNISNLEALRKFRGIAKSDQTPNKEEWYQQ